MIFAQYYLDCLSQASYLIADETTGRAVVVDPRRDVAEYLADAARARPARSRASSTPTSTPTSSPGTWSWPQATGAWIGYGQRAAEAEYPIRRLADGERISLGDVTLQIMETPGHTPESISVLVFEHAGRRVALRRADRRRAVHRRRRPAGPARLDRRAQPTSSAGCSTTAIQHKLMALPDAVRVFPAHGAGSACGKNLSTERQSTIGEQRATNYACRPMSEDDFVALVTAGQPAGPGLLRLRRRSSTASSTRSSTLAATRGAAWTGEVLARRGRRRRLDARDPQEFAAGHLAGSLNVPADGRFAETAGMVVTPDQRGRRDRPAGPRGGGRRPAGPDRLRPGRSATCASRRAPSSRRRTGSCGRAG